MKIPANITAYYPSNEGVNVWQFDNYTITQ